MTLLLYTALRLSELVALDIDDVSISARKGVLVVKSGKGDLYREVPLNPPCRNALTKWLGERDAAATESGRCSSDPRADGCRPEQSIWSCVTSQPEPNSRCPRTPSGTRA